jgi:N-acetylneuraminic acid mutarotase
MARHLGSLVTLVVASLLAGCIGISTDSTAPIDIGRPGRWTSHTPVPTGRQEVAVAALGDRVIVIGGLAGFAGSVGTVEAYRPATDSWETLAPLPAGLHHAAAAVAGGRLYVMGGYLDSVPPWRAQRTV